MRKYVILNTSELNTVDFTKLKTTEPRYNLDRSEFIVSYEGEKPDFLQEKTTYTNSELLIIVNDISNNWYNEEN
jgi:hypothetical protein|tara:strand:+ start:1710 stop:1931 length:222 start_codon:yes stop_codon:yes gene_type:complete